MTHSQKIERWNEYAKQKGIKKSIYRPPMDVALQKLGFEQPPAIFWNFSKIAVFLGIYFGLVWGLIMHFAVWKSHLPIYAQVTSAFFSGMLFGLAMAWYFRRTKKKLNLPEWEDFK